MRQKIMHPEDLREIDIIVEKEVRGKKTAGNLKIN